MQDQSGKAFLVLVFLLIIGVVIVFFAIKEKPHEMKQGDSSVSVTASPSLVERDQGFSKRDDGKTIYKNSEYGFSLVFPSSWQIDYESQGMKYGDLFSIYTVGEKQKEGTEFYDGVSLSLGVPQRTSDDALKFASDYHGDANSHGIKNDVSEVSIGDKKFIKALICEYGCITNFYIKNGDYIYGFSAFVGNADSKTYSDEVEEILKSITFDSPSSI